MSYVMRWKGFNGEDRVSVPYKNLESIQMAKAIAQPLVASPIEIVPFPEIELEEEIVPDWCDEHNVPRDEKGYCDYCQAEPQGDGEED